MHFYRSAPYLVNTGKGNAGLQSNVFFLWGSTCMCFILFYHFSCSIKFFQREGFCCIVFTYFFVPEVCATT